MSDDPYYMTPEEELRVELRRALDRIALLEGQLEDAQLENADLKADLRMVRSGRDTAMRLIRERGLRTPKEAARLNAPRQQKCRGEIVNQHVLPHAEVPKPDFEAMRRATDPTPGGETP